MHINTMMIRNKIAQSKARLNLSIDTLELFDDETGQWLPMSAFGPLTEDDILCLKDNYGMLFDPIQTTEHENYIVDLMAQNKLRFDFNRRIIEFLEGVGYWLPLSSINLGRPISEIEISALKANFPSDVVDQLIN